MLETGLEPEGATLGDRKTKRVSVRNDGSQLPADSGMSGVAISNDGRFVVFGSEANEVVPGDSNAHEDVFPGTLVTLYLERSSEMIIAILAVLKAGGTYVPLDPAWPPRRLAFIVEDTEAALVLTESSLADLGSLRYPWARDCGGVG